MGTWLTIVAVILALPVAGTLLLLGGVIGGRAAMRHAIASGKVHPSCPQPDCPFRAPSMLPEQPVPDDQSLLRET